MLKIKYFAYGSNISIDRLKQRVEIVDQPINNGTPYTLKNYNLCFNVGFVNNCFANVKFSPGNYIEGILYDLTERQFRVLDSYEILYNKQYFIIDENTFGCMYVGKDDKICKILCKPNLYYLNIIIDACKETGLKNTYNNLVIYKNRNFRLKKNKHKYIKT